MNQGYRLFLTCESTIFVTWLTRLPQESFQPALRRKRHEDQIGLLLTLHWLTLSHMTNSAAKESGKCIVWLWAQEEEKRVMVINYQEKEMATHFSILAWRIPWTEEPSGRLSIGLHRVGHNWSNLACMNALKKEMATHSNILAWRIPGTGEPGGLPSMGPHRVGHHWSDLAAAAADQLLALIRSKCIFY